MGDATLEDFPGIALASALAIAHRSKICSVYEAHVKGISHKVKWSHWVRQNMGACEVHQ